MASNRIRLFLTVMLSVCMSGLATASRSSRSQSADSGQTKPATAKTVVNMEKVSAVRPSDANLYAGSDACITCHEEIGAVHQRSPHQKTEAIAKPGYKGCEACHGPGKVHAESGGDTTKIVSFKNLSKAESTRVCLDCHESDDEHANFARSRHARNNVGCVDCHASHKARIQKTLLKAGQPQLCLGCHKNLEPDPSKPSHHKTEEGRTGCTNCHHVHGNEASAQTSRVRDGVRGNLTAAGLPAAGFSIPNHWRTHE